MVSSSHDSVPMITRRLCVSMQVRSDARLATTLWKLMTRILSALIFFFLGSRFAPDFQGGCLSRGDDDAFGDPIVHVYVVASSVSEAKLLKLFEKSIHDELLKKWYAE